MNQQKDLANVQLHDARQAVKEKELVKAVRLYQEAAESLGKTFGKDDSRLLPALGPLYELFLEQGQKAQAVGVRERMGRILNKSLIAL
jgi:hypothetical protein